MEQESEKSEWKVAGAESLPKGLSGLRIRGWLVESRNKPILSSRSLKRWEHEIGTSHLPEMVFGESSLVLVHLDSGVKIHFNALDALKGWKEEALPPVEVPAAAKWKFRSKPFQQVILDYDYTFTTPYCGSETVDPNEAKRAGSISEGENCSLLWEDCKEQIDLAALASKEHILFYDEVVLYEDELADNGVSLLTVKVSNAKFLVSSPTFLGESVYFIHRHDTDMQLRVDGVLMRLRDTRIYCCFGSNGNTKPIVLRDICWRESTFQELSAKGFSSDSAAYSDPNLISERLSILLHKTQKLKAPW